MLIAFNKTFISNNAHVQIKLCYNPFKVVPPSNILMNPMQIVLIPSELSKICFQLKGL